jgi:serine/threonine-protein kinase
MTPPPVPAELQAALAGRYQLDRPIGQGGMAAVFLAHDVRHGRRVAVKVLRPDLSATLGAERFLREIRIAARLNHPNIVMLIDSGEAAGLLYYVMPFVEGESLRQRLDREGALPPADAVRIAEEVADALEYAHGQGVVHRDIKPENILFAAGHAVVADFGVAKAVTTAAERSVTRTGFPVGTVGYMSPEQAAGFTNLDARTDVFSLGAVVYEMLVGGVPGHWPSEEAGRLRRLLEADPEHRRRLDRLPGAAEQALVQALRMRPEDRHPGPRAFAAALAAAFDARTRYSEGQARAIVARAAELEATAPTQSGTLSLGGIQQLAAEVGIKPEHVEAAVRAPSPAAPPTNRFLGASNRIVVERIVEGEVDEADYPPLVEEVRMVVGNVGQASTLGRSLAWRTINPPNQVGRNLAFTVTPLGGRTRLRLEETLTPLAGGLFGGIVGGAGGAGIFLAVGVGIGELHNPLAALAIAIAALGGSYGLARGIFTQSHRSRRAQLEALADRLAEHLHDPGVRRRHRLVP